VTLRGFDSPGIVDDRQDLSKWGHGCPIAAVLCGAQVGADTRHQFLDGIIRHRDEATDSDLTSVLPQISKSCGRCLTERTFELHYWDSFRAGAARSADR
jgi:hypothetical protein